jgi:hypothetical protein
MEDHPHLDCAAFELLKGYCADIANGKVDIANPSVTTKYILCGIGQAMIKELDQMDDKNGSMAYALLKSIGLGVIGHMADHGVFLPTDEQTKLYLLAAIKAFGEAYGNSKIQKLLPPP